MSVNDMQQYDHLSYADKITFLRNKLKNDSVNIRANYFAWLDFGRSSYKVLANPYPLMEKWHAHILERRQNEKKYGTLFTQLYGMCKSHPDNIWVTTGIDNVLICVQCQYATLFPRL